MMNRRIPVLAATVLAFASAGPARAAGDVSETRSVPEFDHVRVVGTFTTAITAGEGRTRVFLSGNRDELTHITTTVQDGTLVVEMQSGIGLFHHTPKLKIELPALRGFSNDGAGTATIAGLNGGDIAIESTGAASIVASGRAARESITLYGAGNIDALALAAHDVSVANDGVGSVRVRADGSLTMNVNGIGEIRYAGKPSHVESHVNGIGSIGRI
jgi:hypothetical protein